MISFFSTFEQNVSYLDRLVLPLVIGTPLILLWVEENKFELQLALNFQGATQDCMKLLATV